MNTIIMAKTSHDSSFSRRHFQWRKKVIGDDSYYDGENDDDEQQSLNSSFKQLTSDQQQDPKTSLPISSSSSSSSSSSFSSSRKKLSAVTVARLRSVLTTLANRRNRLSSSGSGLGSKVVGTLFGYRRGHVHFALQEDSKASPAFLIELATPINGLVREMASGLVRIALECDKNEEKKGMKLLEEPIWRTFCNGKKCGFAMKRECGVEEQKVLKAVEMISMGAGVLPAGGGNDKREGSSSSSNSEGEVMYMRAKFERVVGSRDSEAFYMMNPDSNGGPELSIYLLRV